MYVALMGAAIGSFLNVLVWRLPMKMSLNHPGSHCPRCGHPIRFYDNLPVLGWILLRGKCRDCRGPISIRYPLVEFTCFAITGVIFYLTVVQPVLPGIDPLAGPAIAFFVLSATLFYQTLSLMLIRYDGHPLPRSLLLSTQLVSMLTIGFLLAIFV